ncbi:MAG: NfeD family protein [Prevotellaceae bacterium]|jgi:membrane protein implicated in regulation of membrane protease activity|nr:NfeD family protein [Prevotellaceae bacterium]
MTLEIWHIWMLAGILFIILEIFTPSFYAACIGVGCIATGLAVIPMNSGGIVQWIIFAAATALTFMYVRPFMMKYAYRKSHKVKTNTDSLIGKTGRVTQAIDATAGTGRVAAGGDDWRAKTADGSTLEVGAQVKVLKIESVTITVEKI